jgi:hypothetical protein
MPSICVEAFNGEGLEEKFGRGYLLITTDVNGTPRPCMLSAGEILALDAHTLRVALWPHTRTLENLKRGGRALLCFIAPHQVLYLRGCPRYLPFHPGITLERVEIKIDHVEADKHEGFEILRGPEFTSEPSVRSATIDGWKRTLEALRAP